MLTRGQTLDHLIDELTTVAASDINDALVGLEDFEYSIKIVPL